MNLNVTFLGSSSFHQFWQWFYKDLAIIYLWLFQSFRCNRSLISGCPVLHWNNFQIKDIQNSESESMGKKRVPILSLLKHMKGFLKIVLDPPANVLLPLLLLLLPTSWRPQDLQLSPLLSLLLLPPLLLHRPWAPPNWDFSPATAKSNGSNGCHQLNYPLTHWVGPPN